MRADARRSFAADSVVVIVVVLCAAGLRFGLPFAAHSAARIFLLSSLMSWTQ